MLAKFNLYDFIADIIPGITFIWVIERIFVAFGRTSPFPASGQIAETSVLIVLGYLCGLMLQALSETVTEKQALLRIWKGFPSERFLLPGDDTFSDEKKRHIVQLAASRFGVAADVVIPEGLPPEREEHLRRSKNREIFSLCYHYVDGLSPRPQIFNAQYGLFRCLITLFALLLILSFPVTWGLWSGPPQQNVMLLLMPTTFLILGWLSYVRCHKRSHDFARSVYDLFISGTGAPTKKPNTEKE